MITYIDYTVAFDSISHKFMDETLATAGASTKSRFIFSAVLNYYQVAAGMARANGTDGNVIYSRTFKVSRGVTQGDMISPILFILVLDQLVQQYDNSGNDVKCDRILKLRILGCADGAALTKTSVEDMATRPTALADRSKEKADTVVNMSKALSQHVFVGL